METIGPGTGDPLRTGPSAVVQRRRLALSGVRGHVAKGRDFTRGALQDWGWDGTETSEDALLLVSELLTNASLHAGGCVELVVSAGEVLRIEVFDGSTTLPRRHPSPQRGGRADTASTSCSASRIAGAPRPMSTARPSGPR